MRSFFKNLYLKLFSKKFFKILFFVVGIIFIVFSPLVVFNAENYRLNLNEFFNLQSASKTVLTLYHVESFEGGTNSRETYLERRAGEFNKLNPNCFIVVKTLTPEELVINLDENKLPDMFSFGYGIGKYIVGFLEELEKNSNVRDDLMTYGMKNNMILAYPYILSGYCLITHGNMVNSSNMSDFLLSTCYNNNEVKGVSIATNSYVNPGLALNANGLVLDENNVANFSSLYEAYVNFVNKNSVSLVGTMRDVARCKNREENGSLSNLKYNMLPNFTDLIQYIGVVDSGSSAKMFYANEFAKYLTSNNAQSALNSYGLFSVTNEKIYESTYMSDFENVLMDEISSVNVFD